MKRLLIGMVLTGAVFFALLLGEINYADVSSQLSRLSAGGVLLLVLAYVARTLIDAAAWLLTVRSLPPTPVWVARFTGVLLAGSFLEKTTPLGGFGGEPMKAVVLNRFYGLSYVDGAASLVLRRTTDVVALALFLPFAFYLGARAQIVDSVGRGVAIASLAGLVAGAVLFVAAQRMRVFSRAGRWLDVRSGGVGSWAMRGLDAIERVEDSLGEFYGARPLRLVAAMTAAVAENLAGVVAVYLTCLFLGTPVTAGQALGIEGFVLFVTAVFFFVPANIGTQEGALVLACDALVGSPVLGVALAAVRRARDLLWLFAGGLLGAYYSIAADSLARRRTRTDA